MSKARIIHELHDDLGVTISEAEKAYDIAVEYIRLRSAIGDHPEDYEPSEYILVKASAQPEIVKEYDLKKIYNIYVKIAQAHFVYQPSKPKAITAMPFDWIEVQNLLEKYLEDHGADFDALCREYISENTKDDHVPSAEPEIIRCRECKHYDGRPCGIVDWYNTADDFCSRGEKNVENS